MTTGGPAKNLGRSDLAVDVQGLRVDVPGGFDIVDDVSFSIRRGEVLGLVGESGSGKTTVGMALLGFARGGARLRSGSVFIGGDNRNVLALSPLQWRSLRGKVVSYVPQDPASALNPALRIALQIAEVIAAHEPQATPAEIHARIKDVLDAVGLPSTDEFSNRYIHQLSGGQQQRVGIAMAVILKPKLLVLDEPTTGLDVTTQNRVLDLVKTLCREQRIGALHVAHDLSVIANIADSVMVMYSGRVVEIGDVDRVFGRPTHPYTQALLAAVPDLRRRAVLSVIPGASARPGHRPPGCFFEPRCGIASEPCKAGPIPLFSAAAGQQARCLKADVVATPRPSRLPELQPRSTDIVLEVIDLRMSFGSHIVLNGVSFTLQRGECLALVGESGSGKSTLSRCLIGLARGQKSQIILNNKQVAPGVRQRTDDDRRAMQYVFQSPHNALNPQQTVGNTIGLVHETFFRGQKSGRDAAVAGVLRQVGLPPELVGLYPDQLSGGERQRVAIARALIADPDVLICDEITSALDVSVQSAVVKLLIDLQAKRNLSLIFVTHNIALVRNIADRVMVLNAGRVVEIGVTASVIDHPEHAYTRSLLANTLQNDVESRVSSRPAADLPVDSELEEML